MNRAESLESPLLRAAGFRHAFFTRRGGVSTGLYASLNCSFAVGDEPHHVEQNLRRAAAALSVAHDRLYRLTQVHSNRVRVVRNGQTARALQQQSGDAVLSRIGDLACCVQIADCVPVLLADAGSGAAAAVHAGWRGTVAGVVAAAVAALRELAGTEARPLAAIGPHISAGAFEVGEEVARTLAALAPDEEVVDWARGPRPHADLRRIVRVQLRNAGLPDDAIDDVAGCTVQNRERFFSFRRDGPRSGRHLAGIVPRSPLAPGGGGAASLVV